MEKQDVVIVGAGVIGLAIAYHIMMENPGKKILVLEKSGTCGQGNTAKSAGAYRNVFCSKTNLLLANTSIEFYTNIQRNLKHDIGMEMGGYLWLMSLSQFDKNKTAFDRMQKNDVALKFFESKDVQKILPDFELAPHDDESQMMHLETIEKGIFGPKCGFIDADKLTRFYEQSFKKKGGKIVYNAKVEKLLLEPHEKLGLEIEPLIWQDAGMVGVKLQNAHEIRADKIVIAANSWTPFLLDPIGIDCMIKSVKRQMFVLGGPKIAPLLNIVGFSETKMLPFTVLPKGSVYIRMNRGEKSAWVSGDEPFGAQYHFEEEPKAHDDYYNYNIYQILRKYVPLFEGLKPTNKWAGLYDMNTIDANPYIFESHNVISAVGTSGSGIMKADAIGRITAALYAGKEYADLYGGKKFKVTDLGIHQRNVEKERFIL
ncbi:MAG: FAD-binding oxidoreductase [Thermoplasmata archaeon]